jgi:hypothetical protein
VQLIALLPTEVGKDGGNKTHQANGADQGLGFGSYMESDHVCIPYEWFVFLY